MRPPSVAKFRTASQSSTSQEGRNVLALGNAEGWILLQGPLSVYVFLHRVPRDSLLSHLLCCALASFPGRLSPLFTKGDRWQLHTRECRDMRSMAFTVFRCPYQCPSREKNTDWPRLADTHTRTDQGQGRVVWDALVS